MNMLAHKQEQLMNTNNTIQKQVSEKRNQGQLDNQIFGIESQRVQQKAQEIRAVDNYIRSEKKKRQLLYRDMLGSQIDFKNKIQMQGNMTAVEKQLNRPDLKAYQNSDKNVYSFVPGINHQNIGTKAGFFKGKQNKDTSDNEREKVRRYEALGYNRGYNVSQDFRNLRTASRHKHNNSASIIPGQENGLDASKTFDKGPEALNNSYTQNKLVDTPNRYTNQRGVQDYNDQRGKCQHILHKTLTFEYY